MQNMVIGSFSEDRFCAGHIAEVR